MQPTPTAPTTTDDALASTVTPTPAASPTLTVAARRVPALDGLRGLALLGVLGYHAAPDAFPGGFLGVEAFFVLSGYLLTSLLIDEHRRTGAIDFRRYVGRRLRRVGPGLAVLLLALLVFGPIVVHGDAHRVFGDVVSSLTGVTNWHLIADGSSYFGRAGRPSLLRHLWSVAVEIQFYVVCPFVVAALVRWKRRVAIGRLGAGVAGSALVMAVLFRSGDASRAYYGTDARVGALLAGALLAVVLVALAEGNRDLPPVVARWSGPAALVLLIWIFLVADDQSRLSYPLAFLVTQAATVVVIAAAAAGRWPTELLSVRPLRWLGVRSFGIYLWHWPFVALLRPGIDVDWSPAVAAIVATGLGLLFGSLSYGLVERPFLKPGPTRAHVRPKLAVVPVLGGVVAVLLAAALLARLPTTDPIAATVRDGEQVLASRSRSTVPPPPPSTTTTTTPPSVTTPTTVAPPVAGSLPPSPPPEPPPTAPPSPPAPAPAMAVTAIGDSVMISAAAALSGRLPAGGAIDARSNRQFREAVEVIRLLRTEQRLASVVVVHLGNNGRVRMSEIETLVAEVGEGARLLLVNVRVDAPWRESVNQVLAEAGERFPTVTLVDWYGRSEGHRDWFQSDGTHFTATAGPGADAYAEFIAAASASVPT